MDTDHTVNVNFVFNLVWSISLQNLVQIQVDTVILYPLEGVHT